MNNQNLKPFVKGYDPRRNLKGVPKDAITGRRFIRKVGAELLHLKDDTGEGDVTRFYAMIRRMFSSANPRHAELIMKALMPGLLKEEVEHSGSLITKVIIEYSDDTPAEIAQGAEAGQADPPEV